MTLAHFLPLIAYVVLILVIAGTVARWIDRKPAVELTRHSGNDAALSAYRARWYALQARQQALANDVHIVEGEGA